MDRVRREREAEEREGREREGSEREGMEGGSGQASEVPGGVVD